MATVNEVKTKLSAVLSAVSGVDTKLDTVKELIVSLREQVSAGQVASQEDIDALDALVGDIQTSLSSVTTEVEALDDEPVVEEPTPEVPPTEEPTA